MFITLHFVVTTLLAIVCAQSMGLNQNEFSALALLIPALWVLPQKGIKGLFLVAGMLAYGLTLPHQSIALSVTQWILFPLLMVIFSRRSSKRVRYITASIVLTLQAGVMVSQAIGSLDGMPMITAIQMLSVCLTWWAAKHKSTSTKQSWWALGLIVPLWFAGFFHAILVAISITGIISSLESLSRLKKFNWSKLICWTVPTVGFAAIVVSPNIEVPHSVIVVWMCLLGTAWMTDYILRSIEKEQDTIGSK
ncbi:hypothetical protein KP803_05570 [Vibrio sp. ZSDE26]|uniref:Uncharacterized protein n=1 Tax=Vibrio amylolyticus TaxID=2847292 RepID=A0A9X1XH54_9VIBR|nr:hypothetical protein [Vibrio amylolyticus]MCK6262741.1 hypothetical protein [Vibrio amylolyticus]